MRVYDVNSNNNVDDHFEDPSEVNNNVSQSEEVLIHFDGLNDSVIDDEEVNENSGNDDAMYNL